MRDTIRLLEAEGELRAVWAAGFALAFAASFVPGLLRHAALLGLACGSWKLAAVFPHNSNHFFLEYLCLVFAGLARWSREDDRVVFLRAVRVLPVWVMIWSGLNKLVYGTYFNGAFLGATLPGAGFANVFGWMLPADELARLLATQPPGPYAFSAPLALVASNLVWAGEIVCGVLMLVPRLRTLGLAGGVALLVGIEAGAFEVMFGTLMLNMMGLYAPAAWSRRLLLGSALFYASLVASKLGLLPDWGFN
ncbi:MAG: hypothetical protein ACQGVC_12220 [Myxococcota bacterium]